MQMSRLKFVIKDVIPTVVHFGTSWMEIKAHQYRDMTKELKR